MGSEPVEQRIQGEAHELASGSRSRAPASYLPMEADARINYGTRNRPSGSRTTSAAAPQVNSDMMSRLSVSQTAANNDAASMETDPCASHEARKSHDHFTIRGFVSKVRKSDPKICSPFIPIDDNNAKINLPKPVPIEVPRFRYWRCRECIGLGEEGTSAGATVPRCNNIGCSCKSQFVSERTRAGDFVPIRSRHTDISRIINGHTTASNCDADDQNLLSLKVNRPGHDSASTEGKKFPSPTSAVTPSRSLPLPDLNGVSDEGSPDEDRSQQGNELSEEEETLTRGKCPKVRSLSELLKVKENRAANQAAKGASPPPTSSPVEKKRKKPKLVDADQEPETRVLDSIQESKKARTDEPQETPKASELSDSERDKDRSSSTAAKCRDKRTLDGDTNAEKKSKVKQPSQENCAAISQMGPLTSEAVAHRPSNGSWVHQFLRRSPLLTERDTVSSVRTNQGGKEPTSPFPSRAITDALVSQMRAPVTQSQNSSVSTGGHQPPMGFSSMGHNSATISAGSSGMRLHPGSEQGSHGRASVVPPASSSSSSRTQQRNEIDINALPAEEQGLEEEVIELMARNQFDRQQSFQNSVMRPPPHLAQNSFRPLYNTWMNRGTVMDGGAISCSRIGVSGPRHNPSGIGWSNGRGNQPSFPQWPIMGSSEQPQLWPHMRAGQASFSNSTVLHPSNAVAEIGRGTLPSTQQGTLLNFSGNCTNGYSTPGSTRQRASSTIDECIAMQLLDLMHNRRIQSSAGTAYGVQRNTEALSTRNSVFSLDSGAQRSGWMSCVQNNSASLQEKSSTLSNSQFRVVSGLASECRPPYDPVRSTLGSAVRSACGTLVFQEPRWRADTVCDSPSQRVGTSYSSEPCRNMQVPHVSNPYRDKGKAIAMSYTDREKARARTCLLNGREKLMASAISSGKGGKDKLMGGAIASGRGEGAGGGACLATCPPPVPLPSPVILESTHSNVGPRIQPPTAMSWLPEPNTEVCMVNRNPAEFMDDEVAKCYMRRGAADLWRKGRRKPENPQRSRAAAGSGRKQHRHQRAGGWGPSGAEK